MMEKHNRPKGKKVKGHKLIRCEWNGETKRDERATTAECSCGWMESHSAGWGAREEYAYHLDREYEELQKEKGASNGQ